MLQNYELSPKRSVFLCAISVFCLRGGNFCSVDEKRYVAPEIVPRGYGGGRGAHGAEAACVRFLHTHRRIAYRLSENMPASGSDAPIFANKCCMPGRCMLCKIYICAYENVCMVIAGKMPDLRHFFPILLCLY